MNVNYDLTALNIILQTNWHMEDKEEILFKVRKRNKKIDNNKCSRCLVYDISGKDFHD